MNVLVVKISSMGDIIHTLPAITDVFNSMPNTVFDWVVEESFSNILKWHPFICQVIPIKLRIWKNNWYLLNSWKEYYMFIKRIQKKKYDIVIDAQGLLKTALFITTFTNGSKHGMDFFSVKEPISCWFYDQCHFINKKKHAIERIRSLFASSLQYSLPLGMGKYNIKCFFDFYAHQYVKPYIMFLYATTSSKKYWPEFYWYDIIQKALDSGYHIKIPFWTVNEERFAKKIKTRFNQVTLLCRLTLQEIAIQILQSKAIISVDTGLSHLAAALDCKNLTLYGPTDPQLIGVYGRNQVILKSKSNDMKHLTPDFVWSQFKEKFQCVLKKF